MSVSLFTLFYVVVSGSFIYPTSAFVYTGLTVASLCSKWLGCEYENFVLYQIKRSSLTIFCHSLLPLGYPIGLWLFEYGDHSKVFLNGSWLWKVYLLLSFILPIVTVYILSTWWKDNWKFHPIAKTLRLYGSGTTRWESVAADINVEFRRIDKFCVQTSTVTKLVATDNWVLWVRPYGMDIAHQSDTAFIVSSSDTHHLAPDSPGGTQFLNIEVKPTRTGASAFVIRLESSDFRDLQDKVSRPISVLQNVTFFQSLSDRFLEAFREQVMQNPVFITREELEPCIGCMQTPSNVKLQKQCEETVVITDSCVMCYCKPMWCIDCMGRWFASRQDQKHPETWLSSKCTCPLCRSKFCILDVCIVQSE